MQICRGILFVLELLALVDCFIGDLNLVLFKALHDRPQMCVLVGEGLGVLQPLSNTPSEARQAEGGLEVVLGQIMAAEGGLEVVLGRIMAAGNLLQSKTTVVQWGSTLAERWDMSTCLS
eukprot:1205513-Amorphochlora_amoeboformis.AAC.1